LAADLVGSPFSFGLFEKRKDPIFYSCNDKSELISWVSVCGSFCSDVDVEWKQDDMLEAFNDAVVMASEEGCIVGVNDAALNLFGYTRMELMGKKLQILMPEQIAKHHDHYIHNYLKTNEERLMRQPRKLEAITKTRKPIIVELSLGEIHDKGGKRKFIGRLRLVEDTETTDVRNFDATAAVSECVDEAMGKFASEVKASVQTHVVDKLEHQLRQSEERVAELEESLRKYQKEEKAKKGKEGGSGKKSISAVSTSNTSLSESGGGDSSQFGEDKFVISLKNIDMNERISSDTGSGCVVSVCYVDGWQCAAKVLSLEGLPAAQVAKFESEVSLLESLPPHKNLVRYLFHQTNRSTMRLFMRRYATTLRGYLQERREMEHPFTLKEMVHIGLDLVVGMDVLHRHKIIHRDLKSANIFVTLDGMRALQCCSIGDMDSAKRLVEGSKAVTIIGTPGYMAPEIFSGPGEYSYPVDVWALGIVLTECVVNATKEGDEWDTTGIQEKITKTGQFPFQIEPKLEGLAKIICRCLKKTPKRRPTAEQLKNDFLHLSVMY